MASPKVSIAGLRSRKGPTVFPRLSAIRLQDLLPEEHLAAFFSARARVTIYRFRLLGLLLAFLFLGAAALLYFSEGAEDPVSATCSATPTTDLDAGEPSTQTAVKACSSSAEGQTMNGFVSPFLILGGILCLMGSAALATGRLGLGSRQITVVTCFSLQLVIMAALTLQASKPFPSLDTWMVPFFGELLMSLLAPGPALMLPFATANSLLLRVWPSAERDLTGDVLVIVGGLIAVYNAYVQDYTARQTFSYLPIEGTASLEFLDNPTDRSPTTVMRTALEMLLEKLSVLERRYERNSEVLSVVKYARTAVDKGAKTLFQLDLSSMCFSDSSSNEGQGKSDVRRYVEDLTSGQKPAARVVHSPGWGD